MKKLLLILLSVLGATAGAAGQTSFTAEEAQATYYEQGWDSEDEALTWSYAAQASGNFTWHLDSQPVYSGQPSFQSIDPASKYSLVVKVSTTDAQDERATSPVIELRPRSSVEFYACFRSVFLVFARWYFYVIDADTGETLHTMDAFQWSQENEFTGPSWQKFSIGLGALEGRRVKFQFHFTGPDGEDLAIDGFRVKESTESADAHISIFEGESVHFLSTTEGATAWHWRFPGGDPAESTEQNPTVVYQQAGTYDVTLDASVGDDVGTVTRTDYVQVLTQAPTALIGLPDEGYLSPWVAAFVPTGRPVTYHDLSGGRPTSWHWTFDGGEPSESTEQNPTVVYPREGLYGMTLDVSNAAGTSNDFMKDAVQAGGSQYVWNIGLDEYELMGEVTLGWYGYYGGTNWLGISRFAECYEAPAAPAAIDRVQVWFYRATIATPDAPITLDVRRIGADGLPGEVLAETTIKAGDIAYSASEVVPTDFVFSSPVVIDEPFCVTIGPFPAGYDSTTGREDAISILSVHRGENGRSTTCHYMEDEDSDGNRLGTYTWWPNDDEPLSLCITPRLTYASGQPVVTSRYIGWCDDELAPDAEAVGLQTEGDTRVSAAIHLPRTKLMRYEGQEITKIRFAVAEGLQDASVWIRSQLTTSSKVVQSVAGLHSGWNEVELNHPLLIDGTDLYIGYTATQPQGVRALLSHGEGNEHTSWIAAEGQWADYHDQGVGILYIQACAEGEQLSREATVIGLASDKMAYAPDETLTLSVEVENLAEDDLQGFDLIVALDGQEQSRTSVNQLLRPDEVVTFSHEVPLDGLAEGSHEVVVSTGTHESSLRFYVYTSTYARTLLLEHFTSLPCVNCPRDDAKLEEVVEKRDDVAWVSHHVGYKEDEFTIDASEPMVRYGVNGNPYIMLDRTTLDDSQPAFTISSYDAAFVSSIFDYAVGRPAFLQLQAEAVVDGEGRVQVGVTGRAKAFVPELYQRATLHVFLVEDHVLAEASQAGDASKKYHDNILRAFVTSTRGVLPAWQTEGDEAQFAYSVTATPDASWDVSRLRVVAFVAAQAPAGTNYPTGEVLNTVQSSVVSAQGIGDVEDLTSGPCRVYDLRGVPVSRTSSRGLYIIKEGTRMRKAIAP